MASIAGDTSPVNGPDASQWQFWAPMAMGTGSFSARKYVCTVRMSVKGGWIDTSTAS